MKKANVLLLLIFLASQNFAQTFYQKTIDLARQPGSWSSGLPHLAKQTTDKGIIFTGSYYNNGLGDSSTFIIKMDSNFAVQWSSGLYNASKPRPYAIVQTKDLGFLIAGTYNVTGGTKAYIIKLNKNGKLLWEKHLEQAAFTFAYSIAEDKAGNLFVSGRTGDGTSSNLWVTKLTRTGTISLNKVYQVTGNNIYENKIVSSKDNGFAIIGAAGGNSFVMKADTLGVPVWTKVMGDQVQPYKMDIVETGNRDLTIAASANDGSLLAFQLTKEGNIKWSKSLTKAGSIAVNDLLQLSSGNLLIATTVTGSPNQMNVIKIDNTTGDLIAAKNLKSTDGNIFNVINKITELSYSVTGWDASATTDYLSIATFDSSLQNCIDETSGYTAAAYILSDEVGTTTATAILTEIAASTIGSPWANGATVTSVCENVLPLNLIRFTLAKSGSSNILSWSTSEEINTSYFEIQQSINNTSFDAIGKVLAGKNTAPNNYQFTDARPLNGTNFYRLKIADADGRFTYSPILQSSNTKVLDITIYPNPVKDRIVLNINSKTKTSFNISVTDMQGRILLTTVLTVDEGISKREINASALKQGTYFVRMESAEGSQIIKIIK
ncbi:hypothetical protein BH10BAC2_BH10BAC2_46110 [soil metagenome]